MPIPKTRFDLVDLVESTYRKLRIELDEAGASIGSLPVSDTDWTVKGLLAVRAWWTQRVIDWIEAGRRGEAPVTPAAGYAWNETPRLNDDTASSSRGESYAAVRDRLQSGYERVMKTIEALDDRELLEVGVFGWAGKWPIARWISINTARQYETARTLVRRSMRERDA